MKQLSSGMFSGRTAHLAATVASAGANLSALTATQLHVDLAAMGIVFLMLAVVRIVHGFLPTADALILFRISSQARESNGSSAIVGSIWAQNSWGYLAQSLLAVVLVSAVAGIGIGPIALMCLALSTAGILMSRIYTTLIGNWLKGNAEFGKSQFFGGVGVPSTGITTAILVAAWIAGTSLTLGGVLLTWLAGAAFGAVLAHAQLPSSLRSTSRSRVDGWPSRRSRWQTAVSGFGDNVVADQVLVYVAALTLASADVAMLGWAFRVASVGVLITASFLQPYQILVAGADLDRIRQGLPGSALWSALISLALALTAVAASVLLARSGDEFVMVMVLTAAVLGFQSLRLAMGMPDLVLLHHGEEAIAAKLSSLSGLARVLLGLAGSLLFGLYGLAIGASMARALAGLLFWRSAVRRKRIRTDAISYFTS